MSVNISKMNDTQTNPHAGEKKNVREELWRIQHCQFEDLRFADTKAGVILTLSAAIAAISNTIKMDSHPTSEFLRICLVLLYCFAAATIVCATTAIVSAATRRFQEAPGPITHFSGIAIDQYPDPITYLEKVEMISERDFDLELAKDIKRMANKAAIKYKWVAFSVVFIGLELACYLLALAARVLGIT